MQALLLEDSLILRLRDFDDPVAGPGEVVVDVAVAGIGGSEYLGYRNPGLRPLPNIMGHGIAGVAPDGGRVAVNPLRGCGACAFCWRGQAQLCDSWSLIGVQSPGGFAQKLSVPEDSLVALPDSITWEQASFIEPFANAVNAWDLAQADPSAAIAVLGAGSLGLGVVASASAAGCKIIQVSDNSAPRLAAAATLGAEAISKQMADTYDIVFDTVGSAESRQAAAALTAKGGRCIFMGFATPTSEIDFAELIRGQKQFIGAFVYSATQFERAIALAGKTQSSWVQNLSFTDVEPLLKRYLKNDFSTLKGALRPNGHQ